MHPSSYFLRTQQLRETVWAAGNGLTLPERAVLNLLCLFADNRGWCHPAMETLKDKTGVSWGTVTKALEGLEGRGLVERERIWRGYKFHLVRAAVMALKDSGSFAAGTNENDCHSAEVRMSFAADANVIRSRCECTEGSQLRETNEGGGSPSPSFDSFWELAPPEAAVKRPEVEREWNRVPEAEREAACRCLAAFIEAGAPVPELRFFVRDARWRDKRWPEPVDERRDAIEAFRRRYEGERWLEAAVAWIEADRERPVDADAFFRAEAGRG